MVGERNMCEQSHFINWVKNGERRQWWNNGVLKSLATYVDGKISSEYKQWYANTQLHMQVTHVDGYEQGECFIWWSNGNIQSHSHFYEGQLFGKYNKWDIEGNVKCDGWMLFGKLIDEREMQLLVRIVNKTKTKFRIRRAFGLNISGFNRCIKSLKSREFCEWWYSPYAPGGKHQKRVLSGWLDSKLTHQ
jgi:hypothetical protein